MSGKDWDEEKREWVAYNLPDEAATILSLSDEDFLKTLGEADLRAFEEAVSWSVPYCGVTLCFR
jgi:hypothetical protein